MSDVVESQKTYGSTDPLVNYTVEHSLRQTDTLKKVMEATLGHEMFYYMSAVEVLQLIGNFVQLIGGKKVLDIGVFTGASCIAMAQAMAPDGEVHALEINEEPVKIGKKIWTEAGLAHKVHLHIAPAGETLQRFINEGQAGTFDFAFIDADKTGYDEYYEECLVLVRRGGMIVLDNTLWGGYVLDQNNQNPNTVAIRNLNKKLKDDQRINLSFLSIADGLTLCFIK